MAHTAAYPHPHTHTDTHTHIHSHTQQLYLCEGTLAGKRRSCWESSRRGRRSRTMRSGRRSLRTGLLTSGGAKRYRCSRTGRVQAMSWHRRRQGGRGLLVKQGRGSKAKRTRGVGIVLIHLLLDRCARQELNRQRRKENMAKFQQLLASVRAIPRASTQAHEGRHASLSCAHRHKQSARSCVRTDMCRTVAFLAISCRKSLRSRRGPRRSPCSPRRRRTRRMRPCSRWTLSIV
jgi:hypothetical protein